LGDEDEEEEDDDDDDEAFDRQLDAWEAEDRKKRAKEMFSATRALQTLEAIEGGGERAQWTSSQHKKKTKNEIPLHKYDDDDDNNNNKRIKTRNPQTIIYRQERRGMDVATFVNDLLIAMHHQQPHTSLFSRSRGDVSVWIEHVKMSADLRHAVLYWDALNMQSLVLEEDHIELNNDNATRKGISKTQARRIQWKLDKMKPWLRIRMSQHLRLKVRRLIFVLCLKCRHIRSHYLHPYHMCYFMYSLHPIYLYLYIIW
jgi:hypothetical protein